MTSQLRILHIGNGKAFKIKAIADAFVQRGHDVHIVAIPPTDGQWDGVTWHRLPDPPVPGQGKVVARMIQVRRLARRLKPHVVHAHNAWGPGWYGASVGLHPFVVHAYGGDVLPEQVAGRPALARALTSWTCQSADRIVVTGRHMIDAAAVLGVPRERLLLLPRGVDLDRYRPGLDASALRTRLGIDRNAPVVLSPRYQIDEALYNLDVVVDAFTRFREQYPTAICVQMYDPAREGGRASLEAQARDRGLAGAYRLVPAVANPDMPLFYNMADVVVSVPSSDGFPVTVLEASACAVPLVVSDLPYCAEWFKNGVNGLIVPVRDAAATAASLAALMRDPVRRQQIGEAAHAMVAERANYQHCMDKLENVYRELIVARAGRRKGV